MKTDSGSIIQRKFKRLVAMRTVVMTKKYGRDGGKLLEKETKPLFDG